MPEVVSEPVRFFAESNRFWYPTRLFAEVSFSLSISLRVDKFSDSSIDMYLRCFTKTDSWNEWLAVKERLAIEIKQIVEKNKASFAFPSQSIYIEKK